MEAQGAALAPLHGFVTSCSEALPSKGLASKVTLNGRPVALGFRPPRSDQTQSRSGPITASSASESAEGSLTSCPPPGPSQSPGQGQGPRPGEPSLPRPRAAPLWNGRVGQEAHPARLCWDVLGWTYRKPQEVPVVWTPRHCCWRHETLAFGPVISQLRKLRPTRGHENLRSLKSDSGEGASAQPAPN